MPASYGIFDYLLRWLRGTTVVAAVRMLHQIHMVLCQGCALNHHKNMDIDGHDANIDIILVLSCT